MCVQLCPKSRKVLGFRGWKNIYEVAAGPEKLNLTFSASREIITPMIIYPYPKILLEIFQRNFISEGPTLAE